MNVEPLEVYSTERNLAIVKPRGRRFPGIVVQGDTLHALFVAAGKVEEMARRSGDAELAAWAGKVSAEIGKLHAHYERVMVEHGVRLPY
jgi:hypothetical protein